MQIRSCHAPQALRLHQELRPAGSIGSVGFSYKPSSFVLIRELEWRFHYRLTRTVSTVKERFNDTPSSTDGRGYAAAKQTLAARQNSLQLTNVLAKLKQ